ncbi:hypothetical protein PFNF135_00121 [Plasmodium falciparum NF135/5.C10]|nr:hypothetical protein PFNF135_00121 [Plasmodium falciparum NF135/5.C10]
MRINNINIDMNNYIKGQRKNRINLLLFYIHDTTSNFIHILIIESKIYNFIFYRNIINDHTFLSKTFFLNAYNFCTILCFIILDTFRNFFEIKLKLKEIALYVLNCKRIKKYYS